MTETFRLTIACLIALTALPLLGLGAVLTMAGRRVWAVADRVGSQRCE